MVVSVGVGLRQEGASGVLQLYPLQQDQQGQSVMFQDSRLEKIEISLFFFTLQSNVSFTTEHLLSVSRTDNINGSTGGAVVTIREGL